ncbi:unnamed protein product, partial [Schistosoma rodhaini]|uniref:Uncharacterized protein n=1 Tax=Schistosoma rodhaini TaxID=6188 RepID=A0AA85FMX0_9TREM
SLHYYYYSKRIHRYQLHPLVNGSFIEFGDDHMSLHLFSMLPVKFSFKYYDGHVDEFNITTV